MGYTKRCHWCGQEKRVPEDFRKSTRGLDGYRQKCNECCREQNREYQRRFYEKLKAEKGGALNERKKDYGRRTRVRREFGLTVEEYDRLMKNPATGLAVQCYNPDCINPADHLDHDHQFVLHCGQDHDRATNLAIRRASIRKPLCRRCNQVLGLLGETDLAMLPRGLVVYLQLYGKDGTIADRSVFTIRQLSGYPKEEQYLPSA